MLLCVVAPLLSTCWGWDIVGSDFFIGENYLAVAPLPLSTFWVREEYLISENYTANIYVTNVMYVLAAIAKLKIVQKCASFDLGSPYVGIRKNYTDIFAKDQTPTTQSNKSPNTTVTHPRKPSILFSMGTSSNKNNQQKIHQSPAFNQQQYPLT